MDSSPLRPQSLADRVFLGSPLCNLTSWKITVQEMLKTQIKTSKDHGNKEEVRGSFQDRTRAVNKANSLLGPQSVRLTDHTG